VVLGLLVLFLSGVLVGGVGTAIYFTHTIDQGFTHGQPQVRKFIMKKLVRELDLTQTQRDRTEEIVGRIQENLATFRKEHHSEIEAIIAEGIQQIKAQLTSVQQEKLDRFVERLKQHREHPPMGRGADWIKPGGRNRAAPSNSFQGVPAEATASSQ